MKLLELKKRTGADFCALYEAGAASAFFDLIHDEDNFLQTSSIMSSPASCPDITKMAQEAHRVGQLLVVDNSVPSFMGARVLRVGADVVYERCGEFLLVYSTCARVIEKLSSFEASTLNEIEIDEEAALSRWKRGSDCAAAFVSYLECLPKLDKLAYPGRAQDESHERALKLYEFGFGPYVSVWLQGMSRMDINCEERELKDLILNFESY